MRLCFYLFIPTYCNRHTVCASVAEAITPFPSSTKPPNYTHVIVATKALPGLSPTPSILAPLLSKEYTTHHRTQPVYLLLQNGLGVERELYGALKEEIGWEEPKVVSSALWIGTNLVGPGEVRHSDFVRLRLSSRRDLKLCAKYTSQDRMHIGMYKPGETQATATEFRDEEEKATLDDIAELLKEGGSAEVTVVPEVQRVKFRKNFW